MESLTTHPSTALQAKAFTGPASLSFPGGTDGLNSSASETEAQKMKNGSQSSSLVPGASVAQTPATPAATPSGQTGVSGIVPTLQ